MASKARARSRGKIGKGSRRRTPKKEKFVAKTSKRKPVDYSKLTGRDRGIVKSQKKSKAGNIKELQQSVGSLDRRINKAIEKGDVDVAKDLRSRKNKFTTDLGIARALQLDGGVARSKDGKILRSSTTGQPLLTSGGREIFDQTKDLDFVDPTRRLQNVAPDAYKEMYPISSAIQGGPLGLQMIKNALDREDKDIPYRYPEADNIFGEGDFPAQRYPLDYNEWWRQDENPPEAAPVEEVKISDLVPEVSFQGVRPSAADILESQGISEDFIYPTNAATGEKEVGNTALQLAYDDEVLAALNKNIAQHFDSEGRYTEKLPNPYMYPENKKAALIAEAINNQRKLSNQEKKNLEDKGISEHYIQMYPNTKLTEQSLSSDFTDTSDRENTTAGQMGADFVSDMADIGGFAGLDFMYPGYSGIRTSLSDYADSLDQAQDQDQNLENIDTGVSEVYLNNAPDTKLTAQTLNQGGVSLDELRLQYPYLNDAQLINAGKFNWSK